MKRRPSHAPNLLLVACVILIAWTLLRPPKHAPVPTPSPTVNMTQPGVSAFTATNLPVYPRIIVDGRGKSVTVKAMPYHIVSLAPSVTEILYALKLGDRLAADTPSCDYPPEATKKPHVDPLNGDREKIEVYNPDLILAVDKIDSPKLIAALENDGFPVVVMKAETLQEMYDGLKLIGQATGQDHAGAQMAQDMQARIADVAKTVSAAPDKPGVLLMYSDNPIYTTGANSYITDVIRSAGGTNIVTEPLPSEIIAPEKVVERQPNVIICSPMLIPKVKQLPGWNVVPAVAQNRFFQTGGESALVRPGPRLAQAVEDLARYLHPNLFPK